MNVKKQQETIQQLLDAGFTKVKLYEDALAYTYFDGCIEIEPNKVRNVEIRVDKEGFEWRYLGVSSEKLHWFTSYYLKELQESNNHAQKETVDKGIEDTDTDNTKVDILTQSKINNNIQEEDGNLIAQEVVLNTEAAVATVETQDNLQNQQIEEQLDLLDVLNKEPVNN